MYCWKANFRSFQMRPVFSNISYFLQPNLLFFTYHTNFFGRILRPLKNFIRWIFLLLLEISSNDATKEWFSDLMIKGLLFWKTCTLNLISRWLALAENLAIFVICNWVFSRFNPFWIKNPRIRTKILHHPLREEISLI